MLNAAYRALRKFFIYWSEVMMSSIIPEAFSKKKFHLAEAYANTLLIEETLDIQFLCASDWDPSGYI